MLGALTIQGWICLLVLGAVIVLLLRGKTAAEYVLLSALGVLVLTGAVSAQAALSGFANVGMATVALLFIISEGLTRHGGLRWLVERTLGGTQGSRGILARLCMPVFAASGFLNNTAVVAMLVPEIKRWAQTHGKPASKLLIPLSFSAILGGTCTLMGTSTNLLIAGMATDMAQIELGLFTPTPLALAVALVGMLALFILAPLLLPHHEPEQEGFPAYDNLTLLARVDEGGVLENARLDQIEASASVGLYPVEIRRAGDIIPAPSRSVRLRGGDELIFAGRARSLVTLCDLEGMSIDATQTFSPEMGLEPGQTVELVLTRHCPLVGKGIGNGSFRGLYDGAVLAIAREGKIIEPDTNRRWMLEVGDRLLVEVGETFAERALGQDFVILSTAREEMGHWSKRYMGGAIVVGMVLAAATGVLSIFEAALAAALAMVGVGLLTFKQALASVDRRVIVTIAAAIGLGEALRQAGVAEAAASAIVTLGAGSPWLTLALVYTVTSVLTQFITNNAAAVLVLPFALTSATVLGASPMPFVIATMMAASASFATPFGYQTNLMVYGAGGYTFQDFLRIGVPMNVICGILIILLTPYFFPF